MNWSDTIVLNRPLRDIRCLAETPSQNWAEFLRQAEEAAFERGRRAGEKSLGDQLLEQRAEMAELQTGILAHLRGAVPKVLRETEDAVLALALGSARKIVADFPISAELVDGVVREALRVVEDTAEVTVQLHPEDLALLRKNNSPLLTESPDGHPLRLVGSSEVTRGGCLVQTRFGVIDALRETKLDQLQQALVQ